MAEEGGGEGERERFGVGVGGDQPALLSVKPIEKKQTSNDALLDLSAILQEEGEGEGEGETVKLERIPGFEKVDAFRLLNVLTPRQCKELCRRSEAAGYTFWNEEAKKDFRDAYTVEVESKPLADYLWERIKPYVVPKVTISKEDERRWMRDVEGEWVAYGVNASLVLARYRDGGHFSPHTDGYTIMDMNHRSLFSLIVYLNDCECGGSTRLFPPEACSQAFVVDAGGRFRWKEESVSYECPCVEGSCLAFYQDLPHEGAPAPKKYIIRTDIMYKRKHPICNEAHDIEAYKLFREAELLEADGHCEQAAMLFRRALKMSPELAEVLGM